MECCLRLLLRRKENINVLYMPPLEDIPIHTMEGMEFRFVETLQDVIESFSGQLTSFNHTLLTSSEPTEIAPTYEKDFMHVLGHKQAKRALEIAAAGGHNVLMTGPPGCRKSLLAETFSSILPGLKQESRFEVMSIYQLAGITKDNFHLPPFRNPHHSASAVSLVGGGANPKPGEVSLAHRGVLFLRE